MSSPTPGTASTPAPLAATFASDNTSGVHPAVMDALLRANVGHALPYGADPITARASESVRALLGDVDVLFVWSGTGGNVLGLQSLLGRQDAVLCPASAHINVDECGAPERFTGCKLIDVPTPDGKLRPEQIEAQLFALGDQHHVQPKVVSITQSTELGTLYTPEEITALAEVAHAHGLFVHMDGARLANATASLAVDPRAITGTAGVDVLTFGGTKNGAMYGEAVVWFDRAKAADGLFLRKQLGQLPSKGRYVAAQFEALLTDGLWLETAGHANAMASRLHQAVVDVPGVKVGAPPAVNAVFAFVPRAAVPALMEVSPFYIWDDTVHPDGTSEVRWMCSWDTTVDDVDRFAGAVAEVLKALP